MEDPHAELDRATEIMGEIMELVGVGRSPIRYYIDAPGVPDGHEILDKKLQELIDNIADYSTFELICYIRGSYSSSNELKNWPALLSAARKQSKERKENDKQIFRGLKEDELYVSNYG